MMFWGSTIDPSRAIKYEIPNVDEVFPPIEVPKPVLPSPTTKQHPKPTVNPHPTETDASAGSATTTTASSAASATASTTNMPTPDQGWFPDMSTLITNQKWFFGALGAVAIFGLGAGAFFWKRRMARQNAGGPSNYSALSGGEEVSMTGLGGNLTGGPRTTRELYDAFGELSDDDDYDENSALRPGAAHVQRGNLGFHSGFLDDDEPSAPLTAAPLYRDEPDSPVRRQEEETSSEEEEEEEDDDDEDEDEDESDEEEETNAAPTNSRTQGARASSPNGSSLTESWEHAS
jgi:kexin